MDSWDESTPKLIIIPMYLHESSMHKVSLKINTWIPISYKLLIAIHGSYHIWHVHI